MFFFFVGGVEPRVSQIIKSGIQRCIRCGSPADLVEYEKVLKLFFVPVYRWPAKEPVIYCNRCSLILPQPPFSLPRDGESSETSSAMVSDVLRCHSCARVVDPEFRFCPYCGSEL
ncbi:uncharacterized protein LOC131237501 [Magnolia sinica]|uniref:uncharacterized protein LOC131237501 n=1 Tax=Magnolia sinica TaxID=86752 RepID=UPI00265A3D62|nr:uncharacterized protein LOC131237501 [Magnolia sinica]